MALLLIIILINCTLMVVSAEEMISDELLSAINENRKEPLKKNNVRLEYMKLISQNIYIVRYTIEDQAYLDDIVMIRIGEYKLTTTRPFPLIFANESLYEIKDAYEIGILSDSDLEIITRFDNIDFEKVELLYGDSTGDWCLDIFDATYIQMYLSGTVSTQNIELELSDFDRDGTVSILDATAIQMKLAEI